MSSRTVPRVLSAFAATVMVVSVIGFITALILNTFVLDDYDAYGEVAVPGSGTVHLPAGKATISLHTMVIGNGGTLPVPKMSINIAPPAGAPEPVLTEDLGATTSVNNDAHVRVWYAQIPTEGNYTIAADGNVSAYVNPTLAFGHASRLANLPVVFAATFGLAIVCLIIARRWSSRSRRGHVDAADRWLAPVADPGPAPSEPTDQGVRIEQLDTLARLRDSGALTAEEFEAEKKRLLGGS